MKEHVEYFDRLGISVTYYVGQNAQDNFDILDLAVYDDLWFHVHGEPSCHVIAKLPGKLDRNDMRYVKTRGAELCRQYGKVSTGGGSRKTIMCARVQDVKKCKRVGQVEVEKYSLLS